MFNYTTKVKLNYPKKLVPFLFLSGFSFTDTDDSQDGRGREETIFYSTLPLPPAHKHLGIYLFYSTLSLPSAHKHLGIYLQLCIWDDYHIFFIAPLVFTRLLLDEFYHLIELPFHLIDDVTLFFVCLLDDLILAFSPLYYKRTD